MINRFESRVLGVSEEHITKALTRAAQWKIPNDYEAVRNMQISATPLVLCGFADRAADAADGERGDRQERLRDQEKEEGVSAFSDDGLLKA